DIDRQRLGTVSHFEGVADGQDPVPLLGRRRGSELVALGGRRVDLQKGGLQFLAAARDGRFVGCAIGERHSQVLPREIDAVGCEDIAAGRDDQARSIARATANGTAVNFHGPFLSRRDRFGECASNAVGCWLIDVRGVNAQRDDKKSRGKAKGQSLVHRSPGSSLALLPEYLVLSTQYGVLCVGAKLIWFFKQA